MTNTNTFSIPSNPLENNVPIVRMQGIYKKYLFGETQIIALKDINLTINRGEFIAIWGPSGSGKSTLCNLIGLIDHPTSGSLEFQGQDIVSWSDDQRSDMRNMHLGFIFQSFNLVPVLSAVDNVMLPLQIQGKGFQQARDKAEHLLTELGLSEYFAQRPHKMSGGQQQRVAIARALITEPDLVIADEPTANLDSVNAIKIIDLMKEINTRWGTTFVFSTHDQRLLERVNRRIHLADGVILEDCIFEDTFPVKQMSELNVN